MSFQAIFNRSRYLLVAPDPLSLAFLLFDDRKVLLDPNRPEALIQECSSLFLEQKILIIDIDSSKEKTINTLISSLPPPSSAIKILLLSASFSFSLALRKEVEKEGEIIDCLTDKGVSSIISKLAKNEGVTITERECKALLGRFGKDRALLFSELQKLFSYVALKKSISLEDIDAICLEKEQATLWQIGDALLVSDFNQALCTARQLLNEGMSLIGLIAHLRSQIKTLYTQSLLLESGGEEALIARYPTIPSRILTKKAESIRQYGVDRLKEALIYLSEAELNAKNSPIDDSFVLEKLFMKL